MVKDVTDFFGQELLVALNTIMKDKIYKEIGISRRMC